MIFAFFNTYLYNENLGKNYEIILFFHSLKTVLTYVAISKCVLLQILQFFMTVFRRYENEFMIKNIFEQNNKPEGEEGKK